MLIQLLNNRLQNYNTDIVKHITEKCHFNESGRTSLNTDFCLTLPCILLLSNQPNNAHSKHSLKLFN